METTGSPGTRNETQNYSKLLKILKRQNSAISTLTYYELEDRTYYTDQGVQPPRLIHTSLQQAYYPTDTAASVTKGQAYQAPTLESTLRCVYIYFHTYIRLHGMLNFAQSQLYLH